MGQGQPGAGHVHGGETWPGYPAGPEDTRGDPRRTREGGDIGWDATSAYDQCEYLSRQGFGSQLKRERTVMVIKKVLDDVEDRYDHNEHELKYSSET